MEMHRLVVGLALALAGASVCAAEYAPRPPRPLPAPRDEARVIVQFKPGAAVMRRLSLTPTARNLAAEVQALEQRAALLGTRAGVALAAGGGISERSQVVVARGISSAALAARLAQDPEVEFAVPDERLRRLRVPSDPLYLAGGAAGPAAGQWYLRPPSATTPASINAEPAWDLTIGDPNVVIAVLDTGARYDHADLAGKLLPGHDMITDPVIANDGDGRDSDASDPGDWVSASEAGQPPFADCEPSPSSWHGTRVAGIVAAATDNGVGMAGTGWNIRVLPVRVLGKCSGLSSDIIAGMRWAAGIAVPGVPDNPVANRAKVLNLSLGGEGPCSAAYQNAVNEIIALGKIVIAAAGNSAGRAVGRPANCIGVIGVTALRHIGTKVGFSDLGPEITIAAPGGNCVNLTPGDCLYPIIATSNAGPTTPEAGSSIYTDSSNISVGTSFSSPMVAAAVGLMASVRPSIAQAEVRMLLQGTARAFPFRGAPDDATTGPITACVAPTTTDQLQCYCTTSLCGAGMLDAASAVAATIGLLPRIGVSPAAPRAGDTVTLTSAATLLPAGRTAASFAWTLVDGGGIASGFASATNADTATLVPSAAGAFTVRLTVIDDQGLSASAETTVAVAAAPAPPPPSGGGGGAMGVVGLLALLAATARLCRKRR
jgi:serine protease